MQFFTKVAVAALSVCFVMPAFATNSKYDFNQSWHSKHGKAYKKYDRDHHKETYKNKFRKISYEKNKQSEKSRDITEYEQYFLATQDLLVASDGDVMLTFISKSAAHSSDLFLTGTPDAILNNQSAHPGQVFNLGSFVAGTKLAFDIFNNTTGFRFFTGLPSSNPDNTLHALFTLINEDTIKIGFEDLFGGGDKDYNDLIFKVNNVKLGLAGSTPPIPEPATYLLMLSGLLLVSRAKNRRN
ncbi:MAG: DUF4114 domain-containing protein [Methylotenera sp.]